ncbi:MAG TPA: DUF4124 domain-containing protein [Gammaproteobacteria bacterium]|nr:DUF4124 domain-containing protein [Gammaproteobacteria bacterium]
MNIRLAASISAAIAIAAFSLSAGADQVYRWVDKDGHVHYSQTPPSSTGVNAQTLNINPPPPDPTGLQNDQKLAQQNQDRDKQAQDAQKKDQAAEQQQAQQKKECDFLEQRLQVLEQSARVSTVDAQGNKNYVSDSDRAKQEQDLQDQIDKNCSSSNH